MLVWFCGHFQTTLKILTIISSQYGGLCMLLLAISSVSCVRITPNSDVCCHGRCGRTKEDCVTLEYATAASPQASTPVAGTKCGN